MEIGGQKLKVRIVCYKQRLLFPTQSTSRTTGSSEEGARRSRATKDSQVEALHRRYNWYGRAVRFCDLEDTGPKHRIVALE